MPLIVNLGFNPRLCRQALDNRLHNPGNLAYVVSLRKWFLPDEHAYLASLVDPGFGRQLFLAHRGKSRRLDPVITSPDDTVSICHLHLMVMTLTMPHCRISSPPTY